MGPFYPSEGRKSPATTSEAASVVPSSACSYSLRRDAVLETAQILGVWSDQGLERVGTGWGSDRRAARPGGGASRGGGGGAGGARGGAPLSAGGPEGGAGGCVRPSH